MKIPKGWRRLRWGAWPAKGDRWYWSACEEDPWRPVRYYGDRVQEDYVVIRKIKRRRRA